MGNQAGHRGCTLKVVGFNDISASYLRRRVHSSLDECLGKLRVIRGT
jgi:hypothetical protein